MKALAYIFLLDPILHCLDPCEGTHIQLYELGSNVEQHTTGESERPFIFMYPYMYFTSLYILCFGSGNCRLGYLSHNVLSVFDGLVSEAKA